jgi:hypothetical protein
MAGPLVLRLLPGRPLTRDALARRLLAQHGDRRAGGLAPRFCMSSREVRFVRTLQAVKNNLWIWRCRQDAFAGDFVVVDMSSPSPHARAVWVLELKQGAEPKPTAGHQMQNAPAVLAEIASRTTAIVPSVPWTPITGDCGALVETLSGGKRDTLDG